jgi:hypothetical protein
VAEHRVADRHVEGTVVEGQVAPIADDERQPGDVGPERAGALHEHLGRVDPDDRSEAGPGGDGPRHRARAAPDLEHVRAGGERKLGRVLVEHRALPAIGGPKLEHLGQLRLDGVVGLGDRRVHVSHGGLLLLAVSEG